MGVHATHVETEISLSASRRWQKTRKVPLEGFKESLSTKPVGQIESTEIDTDLRASEIGVKWEY